MPDHAGTYLRRPRNPPIEGTDENGQRTLEPAPDEFILFAAPIYEVGATGPAIIFLLDGGAWERQRKDIRVLEFEADAAADGQICRVIRAQMLFDSGDAATARYFIAKSDGLLRRAEYHGSRMKPDVQFVETHTDVRANSNLTASTWLFEAPAGAEPVESFPDPYAFDATPGLKLGATLPTFSGDALDGEAHRTKLKERERDHRAFFYDGQRRV